MCALHREAGFRKRAQSADDDGSVALAESLQHLTLSEFLKEYVEGGGAARPSVASSGSSFQHPSLKPLTATDKTFAI